MVFSGTLGEPACVEALLEAAKRRRVDERVCLGDGVGPGTDPGAAVALLRKGGVLLLGGPWEAAVLGKGGPALGPRAEAVAKGLSPVDLAWIRQAGPPRRMSLGGWRLLLAPTPGPSLGGVDVVVHAGPDAVVQGGASPIQACPGRAAAGPEAPYLVLDAGTRTVTRHTVTWDGPGNV